MASAAEILVLIRGKDEASKVLSGVSKSASGLGSALGDVGKIAAGFLTGAAITGGISKLTGFMGDSISAAKESIAVNAQLEAVLKSTGGAAGVTADQARELASALEKTSTFEDEAILSGESLLLTFTNIGQNVFPQATQTMIDMSQALGQDMKSSAIQLGKALNDPIQGITALQRVGVSFTDQQKEQIKVLVEAGQTEKAQAVILAELNKEFGGSAKAASDAAGQNEVLKDRMNDLREEIGGKLLPIQTRFYELQVQAIDFFATKALPVIDELGNKYGKVLVENVNKFVAFLSTNRGTIEGTFNAFALGAQTAGDAVIKFGSWIVDNQGAVIGAVTAIGIAFAIFNPGGAILIGLGLAVTAVGLFKTSLEELNEPLLQMRLKLTNLALDMANTADTASTLGLTHLGLHGPLEGTIDSLERERDAIRNELNARFESNERLREEAESRRIATEAGMPYLDYLRNQIQAYVDAMGPGAAMDEQLGRLIQRYKDAGGSAEELDGIIGNLKSTVQTAASGMGTALEPAGVNLVQGFMNGIIRKATELPALVRSKIAGPINASMEQYFDMHSPSKVWAGYGENLGEGLAIGMVTATQKDVRNAAEYMVRLVDGRWQRASAQAYQTGRGVAANLAVGIHEQFVRVAEDGSLVPADFWQKSFAGVNPAVVTPGIVSSGGGSGTGGGGLTSGGGSLSGGGGTLGGGGSGLLVMNNGGGGGTLLASSYATGTPYVPSDGLAYLHRGEAVIPARENRGTITIQIGTIYGFADFQQKIVEAVRAAALGGGFRGVFATS